MEAVKDRFTELLSKAEELTRFVRDDENMAEESHVAEFQAWSTSAANLVTIVTLPDSVYRTQVASTFNDPWLQHGYPNRIFRRMHGILKSAAQDWERGLLRKIEYVVAAATFDDFLDHAAMYHKGNKKVESAVLVSAVLEDAMKKAAVRASLPVRDKSLEELIDALTAANVLNDVKAKRLKSAAALRNHALHAEWDEFEIQDVGQVLKTVREFVESSVGA